MQQLVQQQQVEWVVEEDPDASWLQKDTLRRAFGSTLVTLSLGVLGGSILPVPFALSKTGVLVGALTMLVVAAANDATSCYLIRAAAATGKPTYEELAEWAGGRRWKVFTQATLVVLLWGTMCGGLALVSDVAVVMVDKALGAQHPAAAYLNGRTCMAAVAILVLFPLCLKRHMRELETAATAGVVLVVALIVLLGAKAWAAGFPAIRSGGLPLWSLKVDEHLPEAVAVVGFAFYMQPMMMPLLSEVPPGPGGVRVMYNAVHAALFGMAYTTFLLTGVFGASLFGQSTEGNIMVNQLVEGRLPCLLFYGCMLLYLSLGMTTTQYALRQSLDLILVGPDAPFTWTRQLSMTALIIGSSLAVTLVAPGAAEKIYAVVGATAVCVVCYVIPVCIQIVLVCRQKQAAKLAAQDAEAAGSLADPLLPASTEQAPATDQRRGCSSSSGGGGGGSWTAREVLVEVVVPCSILVMGVGFSIAALYVALKALYE